MQSHSLTQKCYDRENSWETVFKRKKIDFTESSLLLSWSDLDRWHCVIHISPPLNFNSDSRQDRVKETRDVFSGRKKTGAKETAYVCEIKQNHAMLPNAPALCWGASWWERKAKKICSANPSKSSASPFNIIFLFLSSHECLAKLFISLMGTWLHQSPAGVSAGPNKLLSGRNISAVLILHTKIGLPMGLPFRG